MSSGWGTDKPTQSLSATPLGTKRPQATGEPLCAVWPPTPRAVCSHCGDRSKGTASGWGGGICKWAWGDLGRWNALYLYQGDGSAAASCVKTQG